MDPGLWELLDAGPGDDEIAAILRLGQPGLVPEGARVVAQFGEVVTVRMLRGAIPQVRESAECASMKAAGAPLGPDIELESGEVVEVSKPDSPHDERRPAGLQATGRGVVIGVVDWGFDFAHPDFRNDDGSSRILAIWDQRGPSQPDSPQPYGYGHVHDREAIDRALAAEDPYAALGYHPGDVDTGCGTHGTHVASIAGGKGRAHGPIGIAPGAEFIFVHLANWGGKHLKLGNSVTLLEACDFIAKIAADLPNSAYLDSENNERGQADYLQGGRPWVINLSMGRHGEQHDGTTLVEQGLDALLRAAPGRAISQSAGNYFHRCVHASSHLRPGERHTMIWQLAEADVTPNELEIWYSWRDSLEVEVRSPDGLISARAGLGERVSLKEGEREVGRLYHRAREPNTLDNHVAIFLYTTAPPGDWELTLIGRDVIDGRFNAWIERDAACPSCQSRFLNDDPSSTTGTICNGMRTIAVGAYNAHEPEEPLAIFSSSGPTRDGRVKPDLCAPGVAILAARSASRDPTVERSLLVRMSGTSMAAPHVAGTIALMFEVAPRRLRIEETHNLLLVNTRKVSTEHAERVGSGYLDIEAAVEAARNVSNIGGGSRPAATEEEFSTESESETTDRSHPLCPECAARQAHAPVEHASIGPVLLSGEDESDEGVQPEFGAAVSDDDETLAVPAEMPAPRYVHRADLAISDDRTRWSPAIVLAEALGEAEIPTSEALFEGSLTGQTRDRFEMIGAPGKQLTDEPQPGDVLCRRGEGGLSHAALIAGVDYWPREQVEFAGLIPESNRPGIYVQVVEGGLFPHASADRFARLLTDAEGRVPPDQMLLRPLRERPVGGSARTDHEYKRWVQQSLNQVLGTQFVVDSILGPQTVGAIRLFQQRRGLVVDGIVGPITERALIDAGAPLPPAPPAPMPAASSSVEISQDFPMGPPIGPDSTAVRGFMQIKHAVGIRGENLPRDVYLIQILLNVYRYRNQMKEIAEDGKVGPETISAIREFQRTTKWVDGRVDPRGRTFRALEDFARPFLIEAMSIITLGISGSYRSAISDSESAGETYVSEQPLLQMYSFRQGGRANA
ncbi:S8 family serine peptidase [Cupriavidus oxalaticus]|nr:S8 family serine peptidase [Cupriavidus oxalaticus]